MSVCLGCFRDVPVDELLAGHCSSCTELHLHQADDGDPLDGRAVVEVQARCGLL